MHKGDTVIYTQVHYEWLRNAGKWVSKHTPRTGFEGTVVEVRDNDTALVQWPSGLVTGHFCDNLEVE